VYKGLVDDSCFAVVSLFWSNFMFHRVCCIFSEIDVKNVFYGIALY